MILMIKHYHKLLIAAVSMFKYNTGKPSPKLKVSKNKKSMKVKRHVAKKQKSGIGKRPAKVVSNVMWSR